MLIAFAIRWPKVFPSYSVRLAVAFQLARLTVSRHELAKRAQIFGQFFHTNLPLWICDKSSETLATRLLRQWIVTEILSNGTRTD